MIRESQTDEDRAVLPATVASSASDRELRAFVERSLGSPVDELQRQPLAETTSFPCEIVRARRGGETVQLFFKDFGQSRLPRESDEGGVREIEVYRRVLDPRLGAPRHIGSIREPGRAWLLLEHVGGAGLAKVDPPAWRAAAAWPARLQACEPPRDAPLVVHDAAHFLAVAAAAVRNVAQVELILDRPFQAALKDYEFAAERLENQPRVLVHGSYRRDNLLVEPGSEAPRVAPIDWEHAALGSALYDMAFLTTNHTRERTEELLEVFRAAAAEHGRSVPAGDEAWELVVTLRMHRLLRSLSRALAWSYSRETVEHMVALARSLGIQLREARARRVRARVVAPGLPANEPDPHPALRAWRELGHGLGGPEHVENIQGGYFGRRVVYRMGPIGPGGMPVVAKRCQPSTVAVERFAYDELLPRLGISTARRLGWLGAGDSGWIFLEDVGTRRIDQADEAERRLGLAWLAGLHLASSRVAEHAHALPDRGPSGYQRLLTETRETLQSGFSSPELNDVSRELLATVIARCELVERGWERVAAACAGMPAVYVHGDFRPKNLFVQESADGLVLRVIDWEYSGWGLPAVDLGSLMKNFGQPSELAGYRAAIEPLAPGLDEAELWRWVLAGRVMRGVASLHWERTGILYRYPDKSVRNMGSYSGTMERAFLALGDARGGAAAP